MIKNLESQKPKLVFVTPSAPSDRGKGYQVLLYHRLLELKDEFDCEVIVLPPLTALFSKQTKYDDNHRFNVSVLKPTALDLFFGICKVFTGTPLQVALHTRYNLFSNVSSSDNLVFITSRCILNPRTLHPKVVCDFVDSMFLNFSRKARLSNFPFNILFRYEASRMKRHEARICEQLEVTCCVSKIDTEFIGRQCIAISLGVTPSLIMKDIAKKKRNTKIVFSGSLNYQPNITAIKWFLSDVFPYLIQEHKDLIFSIVGRNASQRLIDELSSLKNVNYVGEVPDMFEELIQHDIAIAPMVSGSGMQFKILEAMSVGLPVVATKLGRGDINALDGREILLADTSIEFVTKITNLISDQNECIRLTKKARSLLDIEHSWPAVCGRFRDLLTFHSNKEHGP
jgi:polysaccharide biosynthesis protein PslH